eukprot:35252-Chlamydomonas_euryale.AAC.6
MTVLSETAHMASGPYHCHTSAGMAVADGKNQSYGGATTRTGGHWRAPQPDGPTGVPAEGRARARGGRGGRAPHPPHPPTMAAHAPPSCLPTRAYIQAHNGRGVQKSYTFNIVCPGAALRHAKRVVRAESPAPLGPPALWVAGTASAAAHVGTRRPLASAGIAFSPIAVASELHTAARSAEPRGAAERRPLG